MSNSQSKEQLSSADNDVKSVGDNEREQQSGKSWKKLLAVHKQTEKEARRMADIQNLRRATMAVAASDLMMQKTPFRRVVQEARRTVAPNYWLDKDAVKELHAASEAYLERMFCDVKLAATHAKREKITLADVELVHKIRRGFGW